MRILISYIIAIIRIPAILISDSLRIKDQDPKITYLSSYFKWSKQKEKLDEDQKRINECNRKTDQRMLSRMVKNGIEDEETMEWWMNRY